MTVERRVETELRPRVYQYGNSPDHDVDRGDHRIPLGDEAVEYVAVENGPQHSYGRIYPGFIA